MKETLEKEEATESGVTLGVASSADDITALVLHTLVSLSKRPLPVSEGLKSASLQEGDERAGKKR